MRGILIKIPLSTNLVAKRVHAGGMYLQVISLPPDIAVSVTFDNNPTSFDLLVGSLITVPDQFRDVLITSRIIDQNVIDHPYLEATPPYLVALISDEVMLTTTPVSNLSPVLAWGESDPTASLIDITPVRVTDYPHCTFTFYSETDVTFMIMSSVDIDTAAINMMDCRGLLWGGSVKAGSTHTVNMELHGVNLVKIRISEILDPTVALFCAFWLTMRQ